MDDISAKNRGAASAGGNIEGAEARMPRAEVCMWSADDCYPATLLHELQQQAVLTGTVLKVADFVLTDA